MAASLSDSRSVIIWDFDGTLGFRRSGWSGCLIQAFDECIPGHKHAIQDVRPHLSAGFPWHSPERPHPDLSSEDWWAQIETIMSRACQRLGIGSKEAWLMARRARQLYIDPDGFELYEDTRPALEVLKQYGWQHIILSNHVPELPRIVNCLGLEHLIPSCLSSANTGFEKPCRQAYEIALEAAGNPTRVWMVGDSITADVAGAKAVGIPAILVRNSRPCSDAMHVVPDVKTAAEIILSDE